MYLFKMGQPLSLNFRHVDYDDTEISYSHLKNGCVFDYCCCIGKDRIRDMELTEWYGFITYYFLNTLEVITTLITTLFFTLITILFLLLNLILLILIAPTCIFEIDFCHGGCSCCYFTISGVVTNRKLCLVFFAFVVSILSSLAYLIIYIICNVAQLFCPCIMLDTLKYDKWLTDLENTQKKQVQKTTTQKQPQDFVQIIQNNFIPELLRLIRTGGTEPHITLTTTRGYTKTDTMGKARQIFEQIRNHNQNNPTNQIKGFYIFVDGTKYQFSDFGVDDGLKNSHDIVNVDQTETFVNNLNYKNTNNDKDTNHDNEDTNHDNIDEDINETGCNSETDSIC